MYIYLITNSASGKVYVGKTNNIERRFAEHKCRSHGVLGRAIRKHGVDNFKFDILASNVCDDARLDALEVGWIAILRAADPRYGYNLRRGGEGGLHTRESRRRLSESKTGVSVPALSESLKGKPKSREHRAALSQAARARATQYVRYNGRRMTYLEFSEETGIGKQTLRYRVKKLGWSPEEAATAPVGRWEHK